MKTSLYVFDISLVLRVCGLRCELRDAAKVVIWFK